MKKRETEGKRVKKRLNPLPSCAKTQQRKRKSQASEEDNKKKAKKNGNGRVSRVSPSPAN